MLSEKRYKNLKEETKAISIQPEKIMNTGEKYNIDAFRLEVLRKTGKYIERDYALFYLDNQKIQKKVIEVIGGYSAWKLNDGEPRMERVLSADHGKEYTFVPAMPQTELKILMNMKAYGDVFEEEVMIEKLKSNGSGKKESVKAMQNLVDIRLLQRESYPDETDTKRTFYTLSIFEEDLLKVLDAAVIA